MQMQLIKVLLDGRTLPTEKGFSENLKLNVAAFCDNALTQFCSNFENFKITKKTQNMMASYNILNHVAPFSAVNKHW